MRQIKGSTAVLMRPGGYERRGRALLGAAFGAIAAVIVAAAPAMGATITLNASCNDDSQSVNAAPGDVLIFNSVGNSCREPLWNALPAGQGTDWIADLNGPTTISIGEVIFWGTNYVTLQPASAGKTFQFVVDGFYFGSTTRDVARWTVNVSGGSPATATPTAVPATPTPAPPTPTPTSGGSACSLAVYDGPNDGVFPGSGPGQGEWFTITGVNGNFSPYPSDLSGPSFDPPGEATSPVLIFDNLNTNVSVSFPSPITNLNLYVVGWRAPDNSGPTSYNITPTGGSCGWSKLSGLTNTTIAGNQVSIAPGASFQAGVLRCTGTISGFTLTTTGTNPSSSGFDGFTLGLGEPGGCGSQPTATPTAVPPTTPTPGSGTNYDTFASCSDTGATWPVNVGDTVTFVGPLEDANGNPVNDVCANPTWNALPAGQGTDWQIRIGGVVTTVSVGQNITWPSVVELLPGAAGKTLNFIAEGDYYSFGRQTMNWTIIVSGGATPTVPPATPTATATATPAGCLPFPLEGCAAAGNSALKIYDYGNARRDALDRLNWSWKGGDPIDLADLGDPTQSTNYELCLFDGSGTRIAGLTVDAGPLWKFGSTGAYTFVDRTFSQSGVQKLRVKSGAAGRAVTRVIARGKLGNLATDGARNFPELPTFPLNVTSGPLRVQLVNSIGQCWESSFAAGSVQRNVLDRQGTGIFKAVAR